MTTSQGSLSFKLFCLIRPSRDGEHYLVYNSCEGWRVVEWDDDDQVFRMFGGDYLDANNVVFWTELPDTHAMCAMEQRIACQSVTLDYLTERPKPLILTEGRITS